VVNILFRTQSFVVTIFESCTLFIVQIIVQDIFINGHIKHKRAPFFLRCQLIQQWKACNSTSKKTGISMK
jgi:hypothetical protein